MPNLLFLFIFAVIGLMVLLIGFGPINSLLQCRSARQEGVSIKYADVIMMIFTKIKPNIIIESLRLANQNQLNQHDTTLSTANLKVHYLSGGDVITIIRKMCELKRNRSRIPSFKELAQKQLANLPPFDRQQRFPDSH